MSRPRCAHARAWYHWQKIGWQDLGDGEARELGNCPDCGTTMARRGILASHSLPAWFVALRRRDEAKQLARAEARWIARGERLARVPAPPEGTPPRSVRDPSSFRSGGPLRTLAAIAAILDPRGRFP